MVNTAATLNPLAPTSSIEAANNHTPTVYLGTGGYSDTDLLGTLYPTGTKKRTSCVNTPSSMAQ